MDASGLRPPPPETGGLGRAREAEPSGGGGGAGGSSFAGRKVSGCSSYRRDLNRPALGCSSDFRSKKVDADLCMHEDVRPNFICEDNGNKHHLEETNKRNLLSPNHEGSNRKSSKKLSTLPCSKRLRINQPENSMRTDEANDPKSIDSQIESETIQFPCPEKSQMVKKKRCQDGKRTDKKNIRATMRTKYDSFVTKAGFSGSDSVSGGNSMQGLCALKSDLHGVTTHVDDVPVSQLLDGSYKYANTCPDKGKKTPTSNENILLSIRKAFSVLAPLGVVDINGDNKASLCLPDANSDSASMSDSDGKDKCIENSLSFSKIQDPCQANFGDSILYQPKVILEKLALPSVTDLDVLLNLSSSPPLQSPMGVTTPRRAGLPPFSWSFSHSDRLWKPSVDCKLASSRNATQGRWARIGSNFTSVGDDHNCSSEFELKAFDHNEASINQHKIDDLLQDVKNLTAPVPPSFGGALNSSQAIKHVSVVYFPDDTPVRNTDSFGSSSKKLKLLADAESSGSHMNSVYKNYDFLENSESEVGRRSQGNQSSVVDPLSLYLRRNGTELIQKEQPAGNILGCSDSCSYRCKSAAGGCDQNSWHLPAPETSESGYSPRAVSAAKILQEISRSSESITALSNASTRTKWPKVPLQKTMKARKSLAEKTERLYLPVGHHDLDKSKHMASDKHKSMGEKNDFTHAKIAGRERVRWSVPVENGGSPGRLERDHTAHPRPSHVNPVRNPSVVPSPTRDEDCHGQQKPRRPTLNAPSLAFGGTYIKDWSRGRSKRM